MSSNFCAETGWAEEEEAGGEGDASFPFGLTLMKLCLPSPSELVQEFARMNVWLHEGVTGKRLFATKEEEECWTGLIMVAFLDFLLPMKKVGPFLRRFRSFFRCLTCLF